MSFSGKSDFLDRAMTRLEPPHRVLHADLTPLVPNDGSGLPITQLRPAAVLLGLIDRGEDFSVVFTQRPSTMKAHAGQIALPGGKVDDGDETPAAAVLREAHEEIGAAPERIELVGQTPPCRTRSGFSISLFVGLFPADFSPRPCPREVDDVFETPLSFLMTPDNHQRHETMFNGEKRSYYAMPHGGRFIWGVTAGMIKKLYDRLYGD